MSGGLVSAARRLLLGAPSPKARRVGDSSTPTSASWYEGMHWGYRWFRQDELVRRCVLANAQYSTLAAGFETALEGDGDAGDYAYVKERVDALNARVNMDQTLFAAQVKRSVYGRGACDMKAGITASVYAYAALHDLVGELRGKATLTVVSDEESGGRLGSGWIVENVPEATGDCCINGEPSSPYTLRFGEKGILWLNVKISVPGGHGAYTHLSPNPVKIAAKMITELEALTNIPVPYPADLAKAIKEGRDAAERALGPGGADVMSRVSVNIGTIRGGLKVNMIPRECVFEVDLRLPPGVSKEDVMPHVERIAARYPEATVEVARYDGPLWSPPDGEMAGIIRGNARLLGVDPKPIVSLGGSDLKFWRERGVPSYYYGPTNHGMGTVDEYVEVEELIHIAKVHLLSAYEYLKK